MIDSDQQPWIVYLCDFCQNNSPADDATWGLKAASQRFAAVLALQQMAVFLLHEVAKVSIDSYTDNIEKQVDMFLGEFEKRWNKDVGKIKLARTFPRLDSVCYGGLSDDHHFYTFIGTESAKKSALQEINLTDGKTKILHTYEMDNYNQKCRLAICSQ